MATKTISLELDAYEKLRRAKRQPRESFSSVVRRARWDEAPIKGADLLDSLRELCREHPECLLADNDLDLVDARVEGRSARDRPSLSDPAGQ